jgi:Xaa-Pro dipeptidase
MPELLKLPKQAGVDILVAVSPENFEYVAGTHIITVKMIPPRQAFAIIAADGRSSLLVCSIERSLAASESWIEEIDTYTEFADDPVRSLVAVLEKRYGFVSGRLGLDLQFFPQASFERLTRLLPEVEVVDTTDLVASVRAVKTGREIEDLERAAKGTWRAVLNAMAESSAGDTERHVANRISHEIIDSGADTILFMCFASGDRTNQAHAHPTDKVLEESEIIRFDVGGTYGRWASDFARTYSTGSPTRLQQDTYRALRSVEEETIAFVRPGVTAEDVFFACKASFKKHGLAFHMPHIGHSFGVELHENPMLRPGDKTILREGMVLNIEPFCLDKCQIGYHLEDLIVVTDSAPRILTGSLPPLELPVIGQPA